MPEKLNSFSPTIIQGQGLQGQIPTVAAQLQLQGTSSERKRDEKLKEKQRQKEEVKSLKEELRYFPST